MDKGIVLKRGKEAFFSSRHPWIFSGAIDHFPQDFKNGHIYPIYSSSGVQLGSGYFHQGISLSGRILSFGLDDPINTVKNHLDRAAQMRDFFFEGGSTNMFRLINGEGDFIPGLIIDQYEGYLVLQSSTLGIDLLKPLIVDHLISKNRYKGIYEKSTGSSRKEEKLPDHLEVLFGDGDEEIIAKENNIHFIINWKRGQKTGFFLDQREMRKKVGELSKGRKVLNAFSYSGGFSLYALAAGAALVESVDISSSAIELAQRNVSLNQFSSDQAKFTVADVFKFLDENPLNYDFVILDPPAFAKKKGDIKNASRGYYQINLKALQKMPSRSFLLTCSCSYYMQEDLFLSVIRKAAQDAKREVQIISKHVLGSDHPINIFHSESDYLKSFLLFVL